jgi:AcrR family transcriptional regulator
MTARRLAPRKKPIQPRSQATVNAILQAAAYILVREGWEQFTTNRVAERAGVNIASVYQYFPNKEVIVAELQRQHSEEIRELFSKILPELSTQRDLRSLLRIVVIAVLREHRVAPALHRAFSEELPRSARQASPKRDAMTQIWGDLVRPFLQNVPDAEVANFVARAALHAAIHEAANEHPELLESPAFIDELVTLLARYLQRPSPRNRSQRRLARP